MLAAGLGAPLVRLQCYEGLDTASAVYEWNYPRQMIEIRLAEAAGRRRARDARARHLHAALPAAPAAAAGAVAGRRRRAGAPDRRARPRRRAVRGVPARGAVRFPGDDPRARHRSGRRAAGRRDHVQPHARDPRCDQAALPVSLGRLSRRGARARDRRRKCPAPTRRLAREIVAFTQRLRTMDLFKAPGIAETLDWAEALVALDRDRARSGDRGRHAGRPAQVSGRHRRDRRRRWRRSSSPKRRREAWRAVEALRRAQ